MFNYTTLASIVSQHMKRLINNYYNISLVVAWTSEFSIKDLQKLLLKNLVKCKFSPKSTHELCGNNTLLYPPSFTKAKPTTTNTSQGKKYNIPTKCTLFRKGRYWKPLSCVHFERRERGWSSVSYCWTTSNKMLLRALLQFILYTWTQLNRQRRSSSKLTNNFICLDTHTFVHNTNPSTC